MGFSFFFPIHMRLSSYTEVQRKGSVAYRRDPAAIGFDLPQKQTATGCRRTQLKLHFPLAHTDRTHHLNFEHAQCPKDSRHQFT